jgi:CHASE3 domain sensor protein
MSMPIFWRIILGYSVILLLASGVAAYSIVQLGGLSGTARSALDSENRMMAYQETLTDAFLSEVRYAGRFLLTRADAHQKEFRQFKEDFKRYMGEMTSRATAVEIKARLLRTGEFHLRYHELFDQEVRYIKAGQPYAQSRYQQEREKILDSALRELEGLRAQLQANLNNKLETMEQAARAARNIAIAGTLVLIGMGVALSLLISRSITKPILELTRRTVEQSEDPGGAGEAGGIPEIQKLSETLAHERHRIRQAARSQVEFFDDLFEQVTAPLTSIQQRLTYLKRDLSQAERHEQNLSLEVIVRETERLIDHCSELKPPSTDVMAAAARLHEPVRPQSRKAS